MISISLVILLVVAFSWGYTIGWDRCEAYDAKRISVYSGGPPPGDEPDKVGEQLWWWIRQRRRRRDSKSGIGSMGERK